ncbi:MAG: hypothetical protein IJ086_10815 [Clostridium sp.]|nr:hypothetical protein [Clostridium sp.]
MKSGEIVILEEISKSLSALSANGTVTATEAKIRALQVERDIEKIRNQYDDIINSLIAERAEAIRIAQVYKNELERYEISDKDIQHLHKTIELVLDIIKQMSPQTDIQIYQQLKDLICVDVLKSIQLLGFNYKEAIGEPLTELCASAILRKISRAN